MSHLLGNVSATSWYGLLLSALKQDCRTGQETSSAQRPTTFQEPPGSLTAPPAAPESQLEHLVSARALKQKAEQQVLLLQRVDVEKNIY